MGMDRRAFGPAFFMFEATLSQGRQCGLITLRTFVTGCSPNCFGPGTLALGSCNPATKSEGGIEHGDVPKTASAEDGGILLGA